MDRAYSEFYFRDLIISDVLRTYSRLSERTSEKDFLIFDTKTSDLKKCLRSVFSRYFRLFENLLKV